MQLKKDLRAFLSSRIEVQKSVKNELRYSWNGSNVMYRNHGLEYCYSKKKESIIRQISVGGKEIKCY